MTTLNPQFQQEPDEEPVETVDSGPDTVEPDVTFRFLVLQGNSQRLDGELEAARISLEAAVDLNPEDPMVHASLGDVYRLLGEHDLGISQLNQAIQLDSKASRTKSRLSGLMWGGER